VGDIDGNGAVDIDDLLQLIGAFGLTGPRPEDINGDEVVNIDDMLMLISAWGNC
jgi:hypothetical protein